MLAIFTKLADWISWTLLGLESSSAVGKAVHFFIEDTTKIFFLLVIMIYVIALFRASLNKDKARIYLQGKSRLFGYSVGSLLGAVTPFCTCSSIPIFLGFTSARIPVGVTLSFLITSPLLNEVALILLGTLLGWKFTLIYVGVGLGAGILGGFLFDTLGANRFLIPLTTADEVEIGKADTSKVSLLERHLFAKKELKKIFRKVWKWVIIGVGVGAFLHGFVPESWIGDTLGTGAWWSVPMAVLVGIPLYSNASGMIPVIETLLAKGLPVGTALALMLSTVGASLPEFILLKEVLKVRLLVYLFLYFLVSFSFVGWIINTLF